MNAPRKEVGQIIAQAENNVNWILGRQASGTLPVYLSGRH